jgi:GNAT acetyltransferase-like protein
VIEFEEVKQVSAATWDQWLAATDRARFYHSSGWMRFLDATQPGRTVRARILENGRPIGYFAGRLLSKYGLKILGSPLHGWTTLYMGPILHADRDFSEEAFRAMHRWVFGELGCAHFEVLTPDLPPGTAAELSYEDQGFQSFLLDLRPSEKDLFGRFNKGCKWSIHKAQREGVSVQEARDDRFVEDYYRQLEDVFAKQRLAPTYPRARVEALLRCAPRERILCLRALREDGECIATIIVTYDRRSAYLWGAASWRQEQKRCPNELLQWETIKRLKDLGVPAYDFGGGGEYKAKYRGARIHVPWYSRSRYRFLARLRDVYRDAFYGRQRLKGWLGTLKTGQDRREITAEAVGGS